VVVAVRRGSDAERAGIVPGERIIRIGADPLQTAIAERLTLAVDNNDPKAANSRLIMLDRTGKELRSIGTPGDFSVRRISPDGQRIAVVMLDSSVRNYKLWIFDLFRDKQIRLTFGPDRTTFPVWAPDGRSVVFASNTRGAYQLVEQPSDSTGSEQTKLDSEISKYPPRGRQTDASSPTTPPLKVNL
jgi:Tol biopolymer transport system component